MRAVKTSTQGSEDYNSLYRFAEITFKANIKTIKTDARLMLQIQLEAPIKTTEDVERISKLINLQSDECIVKIAGSQAELDV